jgi:hypothetical protein
VRFSEEGNEVIVDGYQCKDRSLQTNSRNITLPNGQVVLGKQLAGCAGSGEGEVARFASEMSVSGSKARTAARLDAIHDAKHSWQRSSASDYLTASAFDARRLTWVFKQNSKRATRLDEEAFDDDALRIDAFLNNPVLRHLSSSLLTLHYKLLY